jgi:exoribonuclease-2
MKLAIRNAESSGHAGSRSVMDPRVGDDESEVDRAHAEPVTSAAGRRRGDLRRIARRAMLERGLAPEFPAPALAELDRVQGPAAPQGTDIRDLRDRLWCSIDNDDSRDLDQLSVAEPLAGGGATVFVAIADVDALVPKGGAIDAHAAHNTTSVYTAGGVFAMLPEKLSTDLTSLNEAEDRLAVVVEMAVKADGTVGASSIYRAAVRNHAKLTYDAVGAWLEGRAPAPPNVASVRGLGELLRLQDRAAQALRDLRHQHGALSLETIEARAVFEGDVLTDLRVEEPNHAKQLIEDFMIAANGATAAFLEVRRVPSFRRVLRSPERWQRIVELARAQGGRLPAEPDPKALEAFLARQRDADPDRFPDLSLSIVKLMGRGEYVVEAPGAKATEHFGLAVHDYTHSTAPNRRFPDLLTQRLLKAALAGRAPPYPTAELEGLARHCTAQEDAAQKVERQLRKSAAALLLERRVGDVFEAIVTGASSKGTWARAFTPPVEGRVVRGEERLDVGDRVRVKLLSTDVERGYIDFARV